MIIIYIDNTLRIRNLLFLAQKRAKLRSQVAHRTLVSKVISHAHHTCASVCASVRVRVYFRNLQFGTFLFTVRIHSLFIQVMLSCNFKNNECLWKKPYVSNLPYIIFTCSMTQSLILLKIGRYVVIKSTRN